MAKITIFGLVGTGTSSVGKMLVQKTGFTYFSSGSIFREMASELGLDLLAFHALCDTDSKYDFELDGRMKKFGIENDNFVVESRLGWYFIPDSIKIKLVCDFDERVKRAAGRDRMSVEEAKEATIKREAYEANRYADLYNITDLAPDAMFDLVIDTTTTPVEQIVEKILTYLRANKGVAV